MENNQEPNNQTAGREFTAEDREFATKMIENGSSPEFVTRKLQERGVTKESAENLVAELMLPIVKKEIRDELSKNTILKGVACLFIGAALLLLEVLFASKVHIILLIAPFYGIYLIIKGIMIKNSKD